MEGTVTSDKGIGFGLLLAALAVLGALVMVAGPGQLVKAWGFALAMAAAALSVVAIHVYDA